MQPEGCNLLAHLKVPVKDVSRVRDSPHHPGPHTKSVERQKSVLPQATVQEAAVHFNETDTIEGERLCRRSDMTDLEAEPEIGFVPCEGMICASRGCWRL